MKTGTDTYIQWKEHYDQDVIKSGTVVTFATPQLEKTPGLTGSPPFPTGSPLLFSNSSIPPFR